MSSHLNTDWLEELPENPFSIARAWTVVGSAGCGKSTAIRRTINNLVRSGVQPQEIMFIMFNKAPVASFKQEFSQFKPEDMMWWGTHHSIMMRLMKVSGKKLLTDYKLIEWGKTHGFEFSRTPTFWDKTLRSLSVKVYSERSDFNKPEMRLLLALRESEEKEGIWTHMRYLAVGCMTDRFPPGIKYVFIDEAQDNGKVQSSWLERILTFRPDVVGMMLAGDDKQAINLFQGSDPSLFLNFPSDRHVVLKKTYRCPPNVLKEANKIINPVRNRSPLADVSAKTEDGKLIKTLMLDNLTRVLTDEIKAGRNILALVRDNFVKKKLTERAFSLGLVVSDDRSIEIKEILRALKRIHLTKKITDLDLDAIVPRRGVPGLHASSYWYKGVALMLETKAFKHDPIMMEAYAKARLFDGLPLEEAELLGFLPEFIEDVGGWKIPYNKWNLTTEQMKFVKRMIANSEAHLGSITVSTIHGIKGMEAENVLVCTDISSRTERTEMEDIDSERRVWYVALTRSSKNLFITQINPNNKRTNLIC